MSNEILNKEMSDEILKKNMGIMQKISDLIDNTMCNTFLIETYSCLADEMNAIYDNFLEDKDNYIKIKTLEIHLVSPEEVLTPIFMKIENNTSITEDEKLSHVLLFYIITESIFLGYYEEDIYEEEPSDDKKFRIAFSESLEQMILGTWFIHPSDIDYFYNAYLSKNDTQNYHQVVIDVIINELSELYFEDIRNIVLFKHDNNHGDLIGWANNSKHIPRTVVDIKNFDDAYKVLRSSNLMMYSI